jgi:hypothetical protein
VAVGGGALAPLMVEQASNDRADFIERIDIGTRIAQIPKQFLVGFDAPLEALATLVALLLAALALFLLARRADGRERRGAMRAGVIAAAALLVPLVLALVGLDYLIARNVIVAWVPAVIALGAGFGAVRAGWPGTAGAAALCALSLAVVIAIDVRPAYQRGDWRSVGERLGPLREPRALVISPQLGHIPLSLYTQKPAAFPQFALPFRDLYVVAVAERRAGQTPKPPRPEVAPTPPQGFKLVEKRYTESFTLLRYRAEPYRYIHWREIAPMKLSRGLPEVQLQVPPGWKWPPPDRPPVPGPPGTP